MIFVEPETAQGGILLERHRSAEHRRSREPTRLKRSSARCGLRISPRRLESRRSSRSATTPSPHWPGRRPRRPASIRASNAQLPGSGCDSMHQLSLKEAAAVAHLSPSRFRHLFVAQTGVSFRAYVLWARVETAVGAAMSGRSWTVAAQEAGFADSAHLSRTCRRMFGFTPATPSRNRRLPATDASHRRASSGRAQRAPQRREEQLRLQPLAERLLADAPGNSSSTGASGRPVERASTSPCRPAPGSRGRRRRSPCGAADDDAVVAEEGDVGRPIARAIRSPSEASSASPL